MAKTVEIEETEIQAAGLPEEPKSGVWYVVLAWFLGVFGVHSFYAGHFFTGLVQLMLTITSWLFLFIPLLITMVWAFLDMLFVNKDAQGVVFSGNKELIFVLKILAAIWLLGGIYLLYANARFSYEETEILAPGQVVSVEVSE
jgi:hypothetical protein